MSVLFHICLSCEEERLPHGGRFSFAAMRMLPFPPPSVIIILSAIRQGFLPLPEPSGRAFAPLRLTLRCAAGSLSPLRRAPHAAA